MVQVYASRDACDGLRCFVIWFSYLAEVRRSVAVLTAPLHLAMFATTVGGAQTGLASCEREQGAGDGAENEERERARRGGMGGGGG